MTNKVPKMVRLTFLQMRQNFQQEKKSPSDETLIIPVVSKTMILMYPMPCTTSFQSAVVTVSVVQIVPSVGCHVSLQAA